MQDSPVSGKERPFQPPLFPHIREDLFNLNLVTHKLPGADMATAKALEVGCFKVTHGLGLIKMICSILHYVN